MKLYQKLREIRVRTQYVNIVFLNILLHNKYLGNIMGHRCIEELVMKMVQKDTFVKLSLKKSNTI